MDITNIIAQVDILLSWKFLVPGTCLSLALLALDFVPIFHAILHDMIDYIAILSVILIILSICKLVYSLCKKFSRKKAREHAERDRLNTLLELSKPEAAVLKYLFHRSTKSAWLPASVAEATLLLHKGYIQVMSRSRKSFDLLNFYAVSSDKLYALTQNTIDLILAHKDEVLPRWKRIRINRDWRKVNEE